MTRITGEDFMLIGLHKMAAERGDGFVPEMLEVSKQLRQDGWRAAEVVPLGARREETEGRAPNSPSNENNVIAFPLARRR